MLETCVRLNTADAKALAEALSCSPASVRTWLQRICERLNVHDRTGAVLVALKRGWITLDDSLSPPEADGCQVEVDPSGK